MSKDRVNEVKPFISLSLIIVTLFSMVFFKMEVRRMGYSVLKELRVYRSLQDLNRQYVIDLARLTNPDRVKKMAHLRLALNEARVGQIIQISGHQIALKQ